MKVYIGQTRSYKLIAELAALGFPEMTNRGESLPKRFPFAQDNGAFKDHQASNSFDASAFLRDLDRLLTQNLTPDFLVIPDIVAGGLRSLDFSLQWVDKLPFKERLYFVVQDGQTTEDIVPHLPKFAGIFVGGSLPWKIKTGASWVNFAHTNSKPCHIGRVGTFWRVAWAKSIKADSFDSTLPLWSKRGLRRFLMSWKQEILL